MTTFTGNSGASTCNIEPQTEGIPEDKQIKKLMEEVQALQQLLRLCQGRCETYRDDIRQLQSQLSHFREQAYYQNKKAF